MNANGTLGFMVYGDSALQFDFSTTQTVNDGNWHHVAAVRSGGSGFIYIDGRQAASGSGTVRNLSGSISAFIGADERDHVSYFAGMMCDAAIYTHAVSLSALRNHYYMGKYGSLTQVPPSIVASPTATTVFATLSASFTVIAEGASPISYTWYRNGTTVIPGATTDTLTLPNVTVADSGSNYKVVVTNSLGSVTSASATLTVIPAPYEGFNYANGDIATQGGGIGWADAWSQGVWAGGNAVASPGGYYRDATKELVASGGFLAAGAAGAADFGSERTLATTVKAAGTVYVAFIGGFTNGGWEGIDLVNDGTVTCFLGQGWYQMNWGCGSFPYPEIVSSKGSVNKALVVYRFDHTATNTQVRIYVNPALTGLEPAVADGTGTRSAFEFNKIVFKAHALNAGMLDELRIGGTWASVVPIQARTDAPVILTQPTPEVLYPGGTATFTVVAEGAPTVGYAWKKGANPIGTDSPSLTIPNVSAADAANYSVTVANGYGSVASVSVPLTVIGMPTGYAAVVMASGPVAYWPLNESVGPVAMELWGGYNGTYVANYTNGVPGPVVTGSTGTAFEGLNPSGLDVPYSPNLNPTVFTVEGWVNPANAAATQTPFCCGQFASPRSGWLFYQSASGWNFRTFIGSGTTAAVNLTAGPAPVAGVWQHLAASWDGTTARMYVDGVLVGSQSPTTTPKYMPGQSGGFAIGRRSDNTFNWPGAVADVALYNRVLTTQEIQSHALNRPLLKAVSSGSNVVLTWSAGTLQSAATVDGTYTTVPGASSPWTVTPSEAKRFYRLAF